MLGCWFGNLTPTYQEHPSPLICLLPASSFFCLSRIDCFFVEPSRSTQAEGPPWTPCSQCTVWTIWSSDMRLCIGTICFYHYSPCSSGRKRLTLISLCSYCAKASTKQEDPLHLFLKESLPEQVGCSHRQMHLQALENPCYKEACETGRLFLKFQASLLRSLSNLGMAKLHAFTQPQ